MVYLDQDRLNLFGIYHYSVGMPGNNSCTKVDEVGEIIDKLYILKYDKEALDKFVGKQIYNIYLPGDCTELKKNFRILKHSIRPKKKK